MRTAILHCVTFFLLCSETLALSSRKKEASSNTKAPNQDNKNFVHVHVHVPSSVSISTTRADITTPLPTIPTMLNPSASLPTINPLSNPDPTATPVTTPTTVPSPFSSGSSWCVASQAATQMALQIALDYACGHGGTDCSSIQPGGSCYSPITVRDHASYAFNEYYQKNPVPNSCNFGDTAIITSTDPSYGTCRYQSTSTSSSVLDVSNASGSTVFGSGVPTNPTTSSAVAISCPHLVVLTCLIALLAKKSL